MSEMTFVEKLRRKLSKSFQVRGFWGTGKLIFAQPFMYLHDYRATKKRGEIQENFDKAYGTDTGGVIPLSEFSVESSNWIHGGRYGPTSPGRFRECLSMMPLKESEYSRFTFIDLGSGKGPTLLYASDLGFASVIGVEFVKALHDIAEENIRRYPACQSRAKAICCDATEYEFPDEPLVVYASNPFTGNLMEKVLANLGRHKRKKYFVHENAVYSLLDLPSSGFLKPVASDSACQVYACE